jgi:hypothetical protein
MRTPLTRRGTLVDKRKVQGHEDSEKRSYCQYEKSAIVGAIADC